MKNLIPAIFTVIALLGCSCESTEPPIAEPITIEYHPGTRDYAWIIDTLNNDAPRNHYSKIWGSSPNDIWIVGGAGDFDKTIIRYDGENWSYFGKTISLDPRSVYGFAKDNVWFGGLNFDIWHASGQDVSKHSELKLTDYKGSFISDIWGEDENSIYAVGSLTHNDGSLHAILLHYDGNKWGYKIPPIPNLQLLKIRKNVGSNNHYLLGYRTHNDAPDTSDFYEFDGKNITLTNIANNNEPLSKWIVLMGGNIYFMYDLIIYKLINNIFNQHINLQGTIADKIKFWGRHEKDFFIQTIGGIGHYNGENVEELYSLNGNFGIIEGVIFDNEVFFIGFYKDSFKFFLVHGKQTI